MENINEKYGYIYFRDNENYRLNNVYKIGKTKNLKERDSAYLTGEFIKGFFIFLIKVNLDDLTLLDGLLKEMLKPLNIFASGGTEFYHRNSMNIIKQCMDNTDINYEIIENIGDIILEMINNTQYNKISKTIKLNDDNVCDNVCDNLITEILNELIISNELLITTNLNDTEMDYNIVDMFIEKYLNKIYEKLISLGCNCSSEISSDENVFFGLKIKENITEDKECHFILNDNEINNKLIITNNNNDTLSKQTILELFTNNFNENSVAYKTLTYKIYNTLSSLGVQLKKITNGSMKGKNLFTGLKIIEENTENTEFNNLINEIINKIIITNDSNDMILVRDINDMFKDYTPKIITNCFTDLEINKKKIYNRGDNYNKWAYFGIKLKE